MPNKIHDAGGIAQIYHQGRTVVLHIYVNTTEDADQLLVRVSQYIKDTGIKPMVTGMTNILEGEDGKNFWQTIINIIRPTGKG